MTGNALIDFVMQWLVVPVGAFVWKLWNDVSMHKTDIALLKQSVLHASAQRTEDSADVKDALSKVSTQIDRLDAKVDRALAGKP
jgi:hypothetical protein